jgi:hypothetical protein
MGAAATYLQYRFGKPAELQRRLLCLSVGNSGCGWAWREIMSRRRGLMTELCGSRKSELLRSFKIPLSLGEPSKMVPSLHRQPIHHVE